MDCPLYGDSGCAVLHECAAGVVELDLIVGHVHRQHGQCDRAGRGAGRFGVRVRALEPERSGVGDGR